MSFQLQLKSEISRTIQMASKLVCPSKAPEYFIQIMHFIGGISLPINSIGLFLIWFKSPKMGNYKHNLTHLQVVSMVVEIYMSLVCPGYYFFPMLGGYNTSSTFNPYISSHISFSVYIILFCFEFPCLIACFQWRYRSAAELENKLTFKTRFSLLIAYGAGLSIPFVVGFGVLLSKLPFSKQYEIVKEFYPNCLHVFNIPSFALFDYHESFWTAFSGLAGIIYLSTLGPYLMFIAMSTALVLRRIKWQMSVQTYKMHKSALFSLTLQTFVPIILLFIPIMFIVVIVYNDLDQYQEFASNTMFLVTAHSMTSTIVMIFSNARYRKIIGDYFRKLFGIFGKKAQNILGPPQSFVLPTILNK